VSSCLELTGIRTRAGGDMVLLLTSNPFTHSATTGAEMRASRGSLKPHLLGFWEKFHSVMIPKL